MAPESHSIKISPLLSDNKDPYKDIKFEKRTAKIESKDGGIIFQQDNVEFPKSWSQLAVNIVTSKYFYGSVGSSDREVSIKQLIDRVVNSIVNNGKKNGYFDDENAEIFSNELKYILINQMGSFNSPVWFNAGIYDAYGIKVKDDFPNFYYDNKSDEVKECRNEYEYWQGSACFLNQIEDNMDSIFKANDTEAKLFRRGSGVGTNNSSIRAKNENITGGGKASGPMEFMKVRDQIANCVKSGGKTRRAAKMEMLNCDHPDILEFIRAKSLEEKKAHILIDNGYDGSFNGEAYSSIFFQNSNFSINVTDDFMKKAISGEDYWTKDRHGEPVQKFNAKEMLIEMAKGTYFCGDPGIQYIDTVNKWHTCKTTGEITTSNPCGEFLFLDNTSCNLFSLNILKFLKEDYTIDIEKYLHCIKIAIIAQEIIVDSASYPTYEITEMSHLYRPLGLGLTNIGALIMSIGLPYDSDRSRELIGSITSILSAQAYNTSSEIASLLGSFKGFRKNKKHMLDVIESHFDATLKNGEKVSDSEADRLFEIAINLWQEAIASGKKNGYRNAQVTVFAPTGTISFMMDADTTGIEPELALVKYKLLAGEGDGVLKIVNRIVPNALKKLGYDPDEVVSIIECIENKEKIEGCPILNDEDLPVFDCSFKPANGERFIHYTGHLKMMAACIPYLSGSISKTVNMPEDATVDDIVETYIEGWRLGLKNVAIYRDGSKRTQPLSTSKKEKKEIINYGSFRLKPNKTRQAVNHEFNISGHKFYINTGLYDNGQPCELFIKANKTGSTINGLLDAFGIVLSKALQHGVPLDEFVEKLSFTKFEPYGYTGDEEIPIAHSPIDYIVRWLGMNYLNKNYKDQPIDTLMIKEKSETKKSSEINPNLDTKPCERCGNTSYRRGSCYCCDSCGTTNGCS